MNERAQELRNRTRHFAVSLGKLLRTLPRDPVTLEIVRQLANSGGSVSANSRLLPSPLPGGVHRQIGGRGWGSRWIRALVACPNRKRYRTRWRVGSLVRRSPSAARHPQSLARLGAGQRYASEGNQKRNNPSI